MRQAQRHNERAPPWVKERRYEVLVQQKVDGWLRNRAVGWCLREAFFLKFLRETPKSDNVFGQAGNAHASAELPPVQEPSLALFVRHSASAKPVQPVNGAENKSREHVEEIVVRDAEATVHVINSAKGAPRPVAVETAAQDFPYEDRRVVVTFERPIGEFARSVQKAGNRRNSKGLQKGKFKRFVDIPCKMDMGKPPGCALCTNQLRRFLPGREFVFACGKGLI